MLVFFKKPSMLTLPYKLNGRYQSFTFKPGRNDIDEKIWIEIVKQNVARFDACYKHVLKEFKPKEGVVKNESTGEIKIDPNMLSSVDLGELAKNTMDVAELENFLKIERAKEKPKKKTIQIITDQIAEIVDIEKKIGIKK